jgi:putative flippase GtrA
MRPGVTERVGEFGRFLTSGGLAAAVNLASAWTCRSAVGPGRFVLEISVVVGFMMGTVTSFFLNRSFTFRINQGNMSRQFRRFFAVGVVSSLIAAILAHFIASLLQWLADLAHVESSVHGAAHGATIAIMAVANYFLIRDVAFMHDRPGCTKNSAGGRY